MTDESELLRDAQQARSSAQDFLHNSTAPLDDTTRQAALDNLVMLTQIIHEVKGGL